MFISSYYNLISGVRQTKDDLIDSETCRVGGTPVLAGS